MRPRERDINNGSEIIPFFFLKCLFRLKGAHNLWIWNDSIKKTASAQPKDPSHRWVGEGRRQGPRSLTFIWNIYFCARKAKRREGKAATMVLSYGMILFPTAQWKKFWVWGLSAVYELGALAFSSSRSFHNRFSHSELLCRKFLLFYLWLLRFASKHHPRLSTFVPVPRPPLRINKAQSNWEDVVFAFHVPLRVSKSSVNIKNFFFPSLCDQSAQKHLSRIDFFVESTLF